MNTRYDRLEALEAKASPGPWHVTVDKHAVWSNEHGRVCSPPNHSKVWTWDENAIFIAAAREAVPSLISDVKALAAALEGVIRVADRATDEFDAARAALKRIQETS